ncbi:hypothetical protein BCV70DRAFT_215651 [Testicularia cyperi]|uniref:Protein kinase domain-containing protein n=1 Tax=Testicularia cyperi TaxID=1882483 RepID=A0A317XVF7_9BASI|nr:hypothetical protein BCV70DRAFT_215651 [Testicularia cyperi]
MPSKSEQGGGDDAGPPRTLEFPVHGGKLVRYHLSAQKGDSTVDLGNDPNAVVLGKGGFGCVYRYAIDESFTPPSSFDLTQSLGSISGEPSASRKGKALGQLFTGCDRTQKSHCLAGRDTIEKVAVISSLQRPRPRIPSVVAVKLCRTPCSGSFDELQKTGLLDKKRRRADMLDDNLSHIRVVRGEGRIFAYLQAARQRSPRLQEPPLVKLLANLPPNGRSSADIARLGMAGSEDEGEEDENGDDDSLPTRLLVFEKMLELDCEQTPQGWVRSREPWNRQRIEKVALEVIQGLQFLHEHNVTHGDLKPSNLMLDPRTGIVKIIDLGASRRFVQLPNRERNNRSAVEEMDQAVLGRGECLPTLDPNLCEGLGSLTGSPYYMAPEILLQATRYTDVSGRSRSVLEDYEHDYRSVLPAHDWPHFHIGLTDLRRGWGIRADVWSWACTVQALLLKTIPEEKRPSTCIISPFDFSFSRHRDEVLEPLYEKSPDENNVPRFHQWCRALPLLIVRVTLEPVQLLPEANLCSPALQSALRKALRHQDRRPSADAICKGLEAALIRHPLPPVHPNATRLTPSQPAISAQNRSPSPCSPSSSGAYLSQPPVTPGLSPTTANSPSSSVGVESVSFLTGSDLQLSLASDATPCALQVAAEGVSPCGQVSKVRSSTFGEMPSSRSLEASQRHPQQEYGRDAQDTTKSLCLTVPSAVTDALPGAPAGTRLPVVLRHQNAQNSQTKSLVNFDTVPHAGASDGLNSSLLPDCSDQALAWPPWMSSVSAGSRSVPASPLQWKGPSVPAVCHARNDSRSRSMRSMSHSFSQNSAEPSTAMPTDAMRPPWDRSRSEGTPCKLNAGPKKSDGEGRESGSARKQLSLFAGIKERQDRLMSVGPRWLSTSTSQRKANWRGSEHDDFDSISPGASISKASHQDTTHRMRGDKSDTTSRRLLRRLLTWSSVTSGSSQSSTTADRSMRAWSHSPSPSIATTAPSMQSSPSSASLHRAGLGRRAR